MWSVLPDYVTCLIKLSDIACAHCLRPTPQKSASPTDSIQPRSPPALRRAAAPWPLWCCRGRAGRTQPLGKHHQNSIKLQCLWEPAGHPAIKREPALTAKWAWHGGRCVSAAFKSRLPQPACSIRGSLALVPFPTIACGVRTNKYRASAANPASYDAPRDGWLSMKRAPPHLGRLAVNHSGNDARCFPALLCIQQGLLVASELGTLFLP